MLRTIENDRNHLWEKFVWRVLWVFSLAHVPSTNMEDLYCSQPAGGNPDVLASLGFTLGLATITFCRLFVCWRFFVNKITCHRMTKNNILYILNVTYRHECLLMHWREVFLGQAALEAVKCRGETDTILCKKYHNLKGTFTCINSKELILWSRSTHNNISLSANRVLITHCQWFLWTLFLQRQVKTVHSYVCAL